jgi:hypothetical protein
LNSVLNAQFIALAASIGRPGLRHVSVSGCRIRDIGTVALSAAIVRSTRLEHLDLSLSLMSDVGAQALTRALTVHRCLTRVHLSYNYVSDAGAVALADVLRLNTPLQWLDLIDNRVGHAGVSAIANSLRFNTHLRHLDLSGNVWRREFSPDPHANGDLALCELLEFTLLRPDRANLLCRMGGTPDRLKFLLRASTGRLVSKLTREITHLPPALLPRALAKLAGHPWLTFRLLQFCDLNWRLEDSVDGGIDPSGGAPSVSKRPRRW